MNFSSVIEIRDYFYSSEDAFILAEYETFKIIDVNKAMLELYGYNENEIKKLYINDLFPDDYPHPEEEIKSTIKRAKVYGKFQYESVSKRKNGEIFWEDTSVRIIDSGENKYVLYHIRDKTENKKIHDQLLESERKYSTLVDNLPGMAYRCKNDKNWTMEIVTKGCEELTGFKPEALIDNFELSYADLILEDDKTKVWEEVNSFLKRKKRFKLEYRIITKDKKEKWVWEKGHGVFNEDGELKYLEGFIIDITAQKQLEEILLKTHSDLENKVTEKTENLERVHKELDFEIKQRERAEKLDKMKTHFLGQVSHEIRTPLNSLLMSAELIREEVKNNKDLLELLDAIKSSGERITRTIQMLLNMSEIMAGNYDHQPEELDLVKIISSVVHDHNKEALDKGIDLKVEVLVDDYKIIGDAYSVSQIFNNLINNAIKFTEKGMVKIDITKSDNGSLKVDVIDTGIGISEENLNKIFLAFIQEDEGYERKFDGNGLGLTLAFEYCKLNNAFINVDSKKGKGSKFSVVFDPQGKK